MDDITFKTEIGKRLKALRTEQDLSVRQLAQRMDDRKEKIYSWEEGRSIFSLHTAVKLVHILDCSLDDLIPDYYKGDAVL